MEEGLPDDSPLWVPCSAPSLLTKLPELPLRTDRKVSTDATDTSELLRLCLNSGPLSASRMRVCT